MFFATEKRNKTPADLKSFNLLSCSEDKIHPQKYKRAEFNGRGKVKKDEERIPSPVYSLLLGNNLIFSLTSLFQTTYGSNIGCSPSQLNHD